MNRNYKEIYSESLKNPEEFWQKISEDVFWFKKPTKILKKDNPPFYKWFEDGVTNTCYNALDHHIDQGRGDKTALIYDSPITGNKSKFTFKELKEKGVDITATDQPISTKDATSKCFLDMLGVFAELENSLRAERQASGVARAKALGKYKGGKSRIDVNQIKKLKEEGKGATAIAKEMGIHRDSVYRLLKTQ